MTDEARMERDANGLAATSEGWFAVDVRDAAWVTSEKFGAACIFEGDEAYAPWRNGRPEGLPI
jgi:hypothetical protein